jgi:hypothetical protein
MATVTEWRALLQSRLAGVVRNAHDVWPKAINPPAAVVRLVSATYGNDFGGDMTLTFDVILLVCTLTDFERGSRALDAYLNPSGPQSVAAALEDGQVRVSGFTDYGIHEVNNVAYMGARFQVEVFA